MVRRRAVLLFSLLAIAHGSIAPVLPSPSHDLMAYLKGRPTDRSEIKQRLKAALSTGNREDAYVIGRYLRRYLGVRHARLDVLLGELAHDLGRLPEARAWALEALKADPAAPKARALLARTESPSTDRPSGVSATASTTTSTGAAWVASEPARDRGFREALRAFHEDRFDKALGAVGRVLERSPGDLEALTLKYRIHLARMETDAASRILADLARTHPGDPRVHVRLGEAARQRWSRDRSPATLQSALEHFATALALDPDNGPALLSLAALHYSLDRRTVADGLYRRATAQRPFADREMVLNDAFILFSRGDEARSLEVLEHYSRTFGSDSGSLLTEGLVRLRMGQKDDAAECLESALRRNPQNLSAVLTIVPVLVTMDQAARALRVISAAEAEYPESAHVSTLKRQIKLRVVTDKDLVTLVRGPFRFTAPHWLESDSEGVLDVICGDFERARQRLAELFEESFAEVRIRVTLDTGLDHPAFYSAETDSITIAAQWFYARDPRTGGAVSAEQFRLHASHMIEHELAHMAFARKVGLAEYRRGSGALPLWVLEGVAEWAAGGVLSFTPGSEEIKALFEDGCMPPARMESAMRVTNGAKDPKANQQAYVQAYFMAKSLLSLRPEPARGLEQFVGFARDALRAGGSVEAALAGRYGLTPEQFDRRWRSLLETDVVRASRPVLSSFAASHSRPAVRGR